MRGQQVYFAIENLDSGQVVRRGKTTQAGIPQGDLILAPNTRYREWLYQAEAGLIGFADFRTPQSGQQFTIPRIGLGLPLSPDSDGDGLSDDAEFVVGTSISNPDSDGDGIKDGPAIVLGLDPGAAARTGIVGSAAAPGTAVDVCAFNDVAIAAESDRGVTVFNVFNRMSPLIIAQVDTPGTAQRVACSGNLVAVADGAAGLAVVDITDPPAARVTHQIDFGAVAQAVASAGGIGFVGLASGRVVSVDLATGIMVDEVGLNGAVQDLAVEGDALYAITPGTLYGLSLDGLGLRVLGSVGANAGRRLFVGGGVALVSQLQGYTLFNVVDPAHPAQMRIVDLGAFLGQFIVNGSGWGLATLSGAGAPDDVSLYDVRNSAGPANFVTRFTTPGQSAGLCIFNGFCYVADGVSGLQVINYLGFDASNRPPTISLASNFPVTDGTNGLAEEGKLARISANVSDDVQVRNVEFYLDGVKVATDGNFPFEHRFITPALSRQRTFRLQARASDTGGNFSWSDTITVALVPDATPPRLRKTYPAFTNVVDVVDSILAYFTEPIDIATLNDSTFQIVFAGADNLLGTGDDVAVTNAIVSYRDTLNAAVLTFTSALGLGLYRVVLGTGIKDVAGNPLGTQTNWTFWSLPGAGDGDPDNDALVNAEEVQRGTNPVIADTDGDGWSDEVEVADTTNPLSPLSRPWFLVSGLPSLEIAHPAIDEVPTFGYGAVVTVPLLELHLPAIDEVPIFGYGTSVARPSVEIHLPALDEVPTVGYGHFVARPSLEIGVPALDETPIIAFGNLVARPPVEIALLGTDELPAVGNGAVVGGPPLEIAAPALDESPNPLRTTVAKPPVVLRSPSL